MDHAKLRLLAAAAVAAMSMAPALAEAETLSAWVRGSAATAGKHRRPLECDA